VSIELSPQQEAAKAAFLSWARGSNHNQIFRMFGYAGTGKTTVIRHFLEETGMRAQYAAFTGKAASVMRDKGMENAATLHSLVYCFDGLDADKKPLFTWAGEESPLLRNVDVLVIDECSMVGEDLANDILRYNVPVVVIGDPAQLPPVKGSGVFVNAKPDALLTEIHRQAEGNPIIQMATLVRTGESLELGDYGDSAVVHQRRFSDDALFAADQILVGTNAKRNFLNRKFRKQMGADDVYPVFGEKLICLQNNRDFGVYNGEMFRVVAIEPEGEKYLRLDMIRLDSEGSQVPGVRVHRGCFDTTFLDDNGDIPFWEAKGSVSMAFGYAITVHKSQGSQWDDVIIMDESRMFREKAKEWLYTGITRAAKKVTVVKGF